MTKILLADDSVTIQKVVELTFSDGKSQVTAVSDGAAALEKIQQERPDIILSDVIMPGVNGYELCAKVKGDPNLRSIPFLFLKGTFESFDEEKARQCGSDGFIVKPFESQELIKKVQELIGAAAQAPSVPSFPAAQAAPPAPAVPAAEPEAAPPPMAAAAVPAGADEGIFDLSDEITTSEPAEEILGEEPQPEAAPEEEDLWSEVSLRDSSSPLIEDKVLEDESFWGTAGEESAAEDRAAEPSGEDLLEEVGETEVFDLTEASEEPPGPQPEVFMEPPGEEAAPQAAVSAEETVELVEEVPAPLFPGPEPAEPPEPETVVGPLFPEPEPELEPEPEPMTPPEPELPEMKAPAVETLSAEAPETAMMPEREPRAVSTASTADLEKAVSAKLEEAIRTVLAPVIGDAARRIVEEVAWEVIPDLAEAMIKSEIERIRRQGGAGKA